MMAHVRVPCCTELWLSESAAHICSLRHGLRWSTWRVGGTLHFRLQCHCPRLTFSIANQDLFLKLHLVSFLVALQLALDWLSFPWPHGLSLLLWMLPAGRVPRREWFAVMGWKHRRLLSHCAWHRGSYQLDCHQRRSCLDLLSVASLLLRCCSHRWHEKRRLKMAAFLRCWSKTLPTNRCERAQNNQNEGLSTYQKRSHQVDTLIGRRFSILHNVIVLTSASQLRRTKGACRADHFVQIWLTVRLPLGIVALRSSDFSIRWRFGYAGKSHFCQVLCVLIVLSIKANLVLLCHDFPNLSLR